MTAVFSLMVLTAPQSSQGSLSAFRFAKAALTKGHRVLRVFFYGDGAYHGFSHAEIPLDECNLTQCWQQLAIQHNIELMLCSGSALRRGHLVDNLLPPFQLVGLGALADAYATSCRVLVFGT